MRGAILTGSCLLVVILLASSRSALAHPQVMATDPPAYGRVARGPEQIRIQFDQALASRGAQVQVYDRERRALPVRSVEVTGRGLLLQARLDRLPPGTYTVAWRALSAVDGHTLRGAFGFAVDSAGAASSPVETPAARGSPARLRRTLSAAAGWMHLSGPIVVAGILLFWLLIEPSRRRAVGPQAPFGDGAELRRDRVRMIAGPVRRLLILSLGAGLWQMALEILDLAGSISGLIVDPSPLQAYLSTRSGQAAAARSLLLWASLGLLRAGGATPPRAWPFWLITALQAVNLWTISIASHAAGRTG